MKKLINAPHSVVPDMLAGLVAQSPDLALIAADNVVLRHPLPEPERRSVALVSGGGSGHEPAHAGYVGAGMLTAAVAGDVFTSPSTDAVLSALRACAGPAGALLIVKNYTGDRLNFGLAAELARNEGIPTEIVVVADDVALRDTVEPARRRGIAGTVLVHKIAGAAAEKGASLSEVARLASLAASRIGSMGVALGACTLPAVGHPGFALGENEIELGLGIHGEAGVSRASLRTAAELAELMIGTIADDLALAPASRVALLVNGLGATPPMELAIMAGEALGALRRRGIGVERVWTGTFLSALDMPGCSLSVLALDPELLPLLDAPTEAPAWPRGGATAPYGGINLETPRHSGEALAEPTPAVGTASGEAVRQAAIAAAHALIEAEALLADLDAKAGDGDLGSSLARGSQAVLALPASSWTTPSAALSAMGQALRRAIGGSSGPFYATALLRAARALEGASDPSPRDVATAFSEAVGAIATLGGARVGDRTMLDALQPAADAFSATVESGSSLTVAWENAARAAEDGAAATASMRPRLGRASYLGERALGIEDGGARAVAIWLAAVAETTSADVTLG
ncbi:dihydroxyacetone kinase family protein [Mesorhizobium sp. RP14(2022)]|uniref:Dihydroxyacetone kinase family protein n=1 Tax=Mesorhizobium liriopis TaxID=2953882 RepID=A0ABT1C321_9HYPH|nr:dihydroxyacetone kinase family protein [Mesorhizobium liriopis]